METPKIVKDTVALAKSIQGEGMKQGLSVDPGNCLMAACCLYPNIPSEQPEQQPEAP